MSLWFHGLKMESEERLVQKFTYHCPYCDQPVSYDQFDLTIGENWIKCPSCLKTYIKVFADPAGEGEGE